MTNKKRSRPIGGSREREATLSSKSETARIPRRAPGLVGSFHTLRAAISEADKFYLGATDSEHRRTAVLMALRAVLEFNKSIIPPIKSLALTRHFAKFMDLSIGPIDETFRKSSGHGLTKPSEERAHDGLIAVAFSIFTEGGERAGNKSRQKAGVFVSRELNRLGIRDAKGARFTAKRVNNIYLDTIKTRTVAKAGKHRSSASEAVTTTTRDRAKDLAKRIYSDQMSVMAAWRMLGERAGKATEPFQTIAGRERLAISFISLIPQVLEVAAPS